MKPNLHLFHASVSGQRGVALILVLWIFIFLFVVALEFTASVREEGWAAYHYGETGQGYYLALAGFHQVLYELLQEPGNEGRTPGLSWRSLACNEWGRGQLQNGSYLARVRDEGGKVSLNLADGDMLERILANLGIEASRRSALTDAILDWRDTDSLHRINGAENDYYLSQKTPYRAKNGPFDTVEELLWVKGVTPELFYGSGEGEDRRVGLREIFTVDNAQNRINLGTAPAEVIHALLGLPMVDAQAFVAERCSGSGEKTLTDLLGLLGTAAGDSAVRQFVFRQASVLTIEAAGYTRGSSSGYRLKGVVRMAGGERGYRLIRWIDRDFRPPHGEEM